MSKIKFYGSLWIVDYKRVQSVLSQWVGNSKLDLKIRLFGEEFVYDSDRLYFYYYSTDAANKKESSFLVEGKWVGLLDDFVSNLNKLLSICSDNGIKGDMEFVEVNDHDEEISEEYFRGP